MQGHVREDTESQGEAEQAGQQAMQSGEYSLGIKQHALLASWAFGIFREPLPLGRAVTEWHDRRRIIQGMTARHKQDGQTGWAEHDPSF